MQNSTTRSTPSRPIHVSLFGASPDTGNQGVNALHDATLASLASRGVASASVFGYTADQPRDICVDQNTMRTERFAAYRTARYYSPDSLAMLRIASRLGGCGHPAARALLRSDAVLDLSAGDSFTDLYGWERFLAITEPKRIAARSGLPLILLPQTIGPFHSPKARRLARRLLRDATQVWVRDEDSFAALEDLLGEIPRRPKYRRGVDMAFALPPSFPSDLPPRIQSWLSKKSDNVETIGINVSGLIYNTPSESSGQFSLQCDYRTVIETFIGWLLRETNVRIVLVPHVLTPEGSRESDFAASESLVGSLAEPFQQRIAVLPPKYSAAELKGVIGKLDWFCGTRMHSTIAALGSGVPAASLAYSMKTRGVFAGCGLGDCVVEMQNLQTFHAIDKLKEVWASRRHSSDRLSQTLPRVKSVVNWQVDEILHLIQSFQDVRDESSSGEPFDIARQNAQWRCDPKLGHEPEFGAV